jgi:NADH dehydrogenase (ubiquinone) Fe-S protein 6
MLSTTLRSRGGLLARAPAVLRTYATSTAQVPANDPNPKPPAQNVSATNAVPTSAGGAHDAVLQESVEKGEELRTLQAPNRQAPNRKGIWSRSQQPREVAMTGPRFEQTIFADQVG